MSTKDSECKEAEINTNGSVSWVQDEIRKKIDEVHDLLVIAEKDGIGGMMELYGDNWKINCVKLKHAPKRRSDY